MFGSDWPVCLLAASYADVVSAALELTAELTQDEQAQVFGGTAARAYGLPEACHEGSSGLRRTRAGYRRPGHGSRHRASMRVLARHRVRRPVRFALRRPIRSGPIGRIAGDLFPGWSPTSLPNLNMASQRGQVASEIGCAPPRHLAGSFPGATAEAV